MASSPRDPWEGRIRPSALRPRLGLELVQALARRRRASGGTVMALVLLVVFGVILSALAISNQIGSGALRAGLMGQSREAREAAETGVMAVITELNKFENRRLLVADPQNAWTTSQNNICAATTAAKNNGLWDTTNDQPLAPTATALALRDGNERQLPGDTARRYVLQRIQVLNPDRGNAAWSSSDGTSGSTGAYDPNTVNLFAATTAAAETGRVGYIRVTVEGRHYEGGTLTSTATVTREFQVVPKCCLRSFGPVWTPNAGGTGFVRQDDVFGPDRRSCDTLPAGANALGMVAFGGGGNQKLW